jgi:hypothetical protein
MMTVCLRSVAAVFGADGLSFEEKDLAPIDAAADQADEPAPMKV